MTSTGLLVMICSLASVLVLVGFCLYRVLTLPAVDLEDLESPLTIDTRDTRDAD